MLALYLRQLPELRLYGPVSVIRKLTLTYRAKLPLIFQCSPAFVAKLVSVGAEVHWRVLDGFQADRALQCQVC